MADSFDFLRERRRKAAENPGLTHRQLNDKYCKDNKLATYNKSYQGVIKNTEFTQQELDNVMRDAQYKKIELHNKINSCGESKIGRNAAAGKHGTILCHDDDDQETQDVPEFKSVREGSEYMYRRAKKQMEDEKVSMRAINSAMSNHILHQVIDQTSVGSKQIEEVGKTDKHIDTEKTKEYLAQTHEKMKQTDDYKLVESMRKFRILATDDKSDISTQHEFAIVKSLDESAAIMRTQEMSKTGD